MSSTKKWALLALLVFLGPILLTACEGETVEVTRVVTEKETIVETIIEKETVIVEGTPEVVEKEVEVTKVVVETVIETVVEKETVIEKETVVEKETVIVEMDMEPQMGGTLTIAEYSEPTNLDPHVSYSRHASIIYLQMFDSLLALDKDKNLHPSLAKSWDVSDDGRSFTFNLRDDVIFHDGTPFNAEAVKYNIDRIYDPDTGSLMAVDTLGPMESVEVLDDYTVRFNFENPNGSFLLTAASLWMVSPTAAEEWGVQDFAFHPVGTGPFKFVEWEQQDHITMERNPDYNWAPRGIHDHEGPAYLDEVVFKYITEPATRLAALETGEVDVAIRVPEHDVEMVEADERFNVIKEMVPGTPTMFILNTNKPPLDDVNVRRALNMWLDRELINDTVWAGQNAPGYGPLTSNIFGYWPEVEELNAFDREGALQVLADAGWTDSDGDGLLDKDGNTLELNIYSAGDYTDPPEAIEGQFVEMGADTQITMVPWSEQQRVSSAGEPSMMVATFNSVDPRILRLLFHSENVGEAGWMWTQLPESDPELQAELDELLERGDMVTDLGERAQIYKDIQKLIVENALNLPMRADFYLYGLGKDVHGWNKDPGGWLLTYGMWKDQ